MVQMSHIGLITQSHLFSTLRAVTNLFVNYHLEYEQKYSVVMNNVAQRSHVLLKENPNAKCGMHSCELWVLGKAEVPKQYSLLLYF